MINQITKNHSVRALLVAAMIWPIIGHSTEPSKDPQSMVLIPAGSFLMGSHPADDDGKAKEFGSIKPWYVDEVPQHEVNLPAFWMDKFEITNAEFREFVISENYWVPETWRVNGYLLTRPVLMQADLATLIRLADKLYRLDMNVYDMTQNELLDADC